MREAKEKIDLETEMSVRDFCFQTLPHKKKLIFADPSFLSDFDDFEATNKTVATSSLGKLKPQPGLPDDIFSRKI
jgi:hypothetical protein